MNQLTVKTKVSVLNLFLNSAVKRIIEGEDGKKEKGSPCYECLKTYLIKVQT